MPIPDTTLMERLENLRQFSKENRKNEIEINLKILELFTKLHPSFTLEEINDFIYFSEVPKREITPIRLNTHLWTKVHNQWSNDVHSSKLEGVIMQLLESEIHLPERNKGR